MAAPHPLCPKGGTLFAAYLHRGRRWLSVGQICNGCWGFWPYPLERIDLGGKHGAGCHCKKCVGQKAGLVA